MSSSTLTKPRSSQAPANSVELFWTIAAQIVPLAAAAASASPAALVKAKGKTSSKPANAVELAAELTKLSEKIDAIRSRLTVNEGRLASGKEREAAAATMTQMLEQRDLLDPASFVERRGGTRQALSKALKSNRVFFVELNGERYFPSFFADERLERGKVEGVSKALGELPGASKLQFFMTRKASLAGKTPLDALADGQYSRVHVAAQGFAER